MLACTRSYVLSDNTLLPESLMHVQGVFEMIMPACTRPRMLQAASCYQGASSLCRVVKTQRRSSTSSGTSSGESKTASMG